LPSPLARLLASGRAPSPLRCCCCGGDAERKEGGGTRSVKENKKCKQNSLSLQCERREGNTWR
jgi:hypothetical protein